MKKFNEVAYSIDEEEEANLEALFAAHSDDKNRRKARWEQNQKARSGEKKGGKKNRRFSDWDDDDWN